MSSRREFFSSFAKPKEGKESFSPFAPYFNEKNAFLCENCQDATCVKSCPQNIIFKAEAKAPVLDFSHNGCTFCKDCATSCKDLVFDKNSGENIKAVFEIDLLKCLAWNKVLCSSCLDPCLERAIKFSGLFFPQIDMSKCTACGFCISRCPSDAITIKKASND